MLAVCSAKRAAVHVERAIVDVHVRHHDGKLPSLLGKGVFFRNDFAGAFFVVAEVQRAAAFDKDNAVIVVGALAEVARYGLSSQAEVRRAGRNIPLVGQRHILREVVVARLDGQAVGCSAAGVVPLLLRQRIRPLNEGDAVVGVLAIRVSRQAYSLHQPGHHRQRNQ